MADPPAARRRLLLHFVFRERPARLGGVLRAEGATEAGPDAARETPSSETPWKGARSRTSSSCGCRTSPTPTPDSLRHRRGWIGGDDYYFQWLRPSFEGFEGEIPRITKTLGEIRTFVESAGGSYRPHVITPKTLALRAFCRLLEG
jgi:hypothetical protein